ncbi:MULTISPECIES: ECF transporter S component [Lawsonibacter]|uniref:ECF transporter S component n=1 Tax=Lawsonibacter hominis TaxID=2763053 RepID=A0A8J6IZK1_9FIRM|nr:MULTISPECIES: ECF transporter S component [Lawsonibacter]MBS1384077.1 ECF transporter S component [Flavonifractor sp.]MDU2194895.1 ECF transporter S component [Clostridiales bacterium]MDY2977789.1 ECF transporter S component [Oscillospiraceae bacterium]MBC5732562.1 ECF transporter S component [Lawsonibacter hominis]MCI6398440.1 ECF transporter S component [Lawsonibacter sp.]
MKASAKTQRLTGLALMTGIIIVLQIVASFIKFGPFTITLALAPIIIGAALYGAGAGAYLGGVFGVVVFIACVAGWDMGGNILFTARPLVTLILCVVKGALAGLAAGAVYRALAQRSPMAGSILAGIMCPVVNTGIFCLGLAGFYYDTLVAWAGGTALVYYVITVLVGLNFLLEMAINLVLSSVIVRVVKARTAA